MNFECRKDWGTLSCIFQKPIFCASWGAKIQTPNLATLSFPNSIRNQPKICLIMVAICLPKDKTVQLNQKKWQAIQNQVHITCEQTLGFDRPTLLSTKTFCSNPSIYQNFLLKTHSFTKITHQNTNFYFRIHQSKFGTQNPSIYQNFLLKPIYLPKFSAQYPSIY